jgi:SAM-dependent MidA family methyltransferase
MSDAFLANPGQQDITHHILWDDFSRLFKNYHFHDLTLLSQEAFFMKNAMSYIAPIVSSTSMSISHEKQSLVQLLHPHHMGAAFQVVSALRQ